MLGQMTISEKPAEPRSFLAEQLEAMSASSNRTSPLNFFTPEDIETLFSMYDVSKTGMTRKQCREALDAIGLESVAVPASMPLFNLGAFKALVPPIQ